MKGRGIKKWFMRNLWRLQQSQMIISMLYWAAIMTLLVYPYVSWRLERYFSISKSDVTLGLLVLFFIVLLGVLAMGFLYDVTFKMWHEQQVVAAERNPYAKEKMNAKELVQWQYFHIPLMKADRRILKHLGQETDFLDESILKMDNWCRYNLKTDPTLKRDVRDIRRIMSKDHGGKPEELID